MIALSALTFDINGNQAFQTVSPNSQLKNLSRRVSRRATLDGNASIEDNGFSHSDRTFIIVLKNAEKASVDKLTELFKTYSLLLLSTDEGAFEVAPDTLSQKNDEVTIRLLANRILS